VPVVTSISSGESVCSNVSCVGVVRLTYRDHRSSKQDGAITLPWSPVDPCHISPREMRSHPIGTGPFKFDEFEPNRSIKITVRARRRNNRSLARPRTSRPGCKPWPGRMRSSSPRARADWSAISSSTAISAPSRSRGSRSNPTCSSGESTSRGILSSTARSRLFARCSVDRGRPMSSPSTNGGSGSGSVS